jgi:hypothetical protein
MSAPVFTFGKGRNQITVKGDSAVRECGWTIRLLLIARAFAIVLTALAIFGSVIAIRLLL